MYSSLVYKNDHITLCHKACKACWGKELETGYFDMCKFIENRVKVGHESVLEHSNVVIEIVKDYDFENTLAEKVFDLVGDMKYLNIVTKYRNGKEYLLMGGSIRGYKELIRYAPDPNSELLTIILKLLTQNLDPCYFVDFIEAGLCTESDFINKPIYNYQKENLCKNKAALPCSIVENVDPYIDLWENLVDHTVYTTRELYKMLTITINFKDLSRAASHQLVRHRNGITQSSMRYIDARNAKFHIPPLVSGQTYTINIFNNEYKLSFEDILNMELSIYEQLRSQNVVKEDARGILGMNSKSEDLYMTFTYLTFIKFLQLRTDKHAQYEIRERAVELYDYFVMSENPILPYNLYDYLIPNFTLYKDEMNEFNDEFDEPLELIEERITGEDYERAIFGFKN